MKVVDNLYLTSDSGNEETFSVTIIDRSGLRSEYQDEVDFVTLNLMLQAEYVTLRDTTIQKKSTRVDEVGKVYFYGNIVDVNGI